MNEQLFKMSTGEHIILDFGKLTNEVSSPVARVSKQRT
jgi:hypothetical protein